MYASVVRLRRAGFRETTVPDDALCRPILTRRRRGRLRAPPHSDILTWCYHVAGVRRGTSGMTGGASRTCMPPTDGNTDGFAVNGGQAECLSGGRGFGNTEPT